MGIKGLKNLLEAEAPKSMKLKPLKQYNGRKIAIDANIVLHQFKATLSHLADKKNVKTGHILGMLRRTAKFISVGIEPIYIFDGTPPLAKQPEIKRRRMGGSGNVMTGSENAESKGSELFIKDADLARRKKPWESQDYIDCKRLLSLLGVPYFQAPSEAEAQCCSLCKINQVYGVASEDSDCFAHGAPKVLINFTAADRTTEYDHDKILNELGLTMDNFIDLCILCGCDYCESIEGMDAPRALGLIRQHGTIENVLNNIDRNQYKVPEKWPNQYEEARRLFKNPTVDPIPDQKLQYTKHNEEGLHQFLVEEKNFSVNTIADSLAIIKKARAKRPIFSYYPREEESSKRYKKESIVIPAAAAAAAVAQESVAQESMTLVCPPVVAQEGRLPRQYWQGAEKDISPPLEWCGVPDGTKSLALVVQDIKEPEAPVMPWTHWVVANISPDIKSLPESFSGAGTDCGVQEGINDWKQPGWRGPVPDSLGHRIQFRIYALDDVLSLRNKVTADKVMEGIKGHVLAEAEFTAVYNG